MKISNNNPYDLHCSIGEYISVRIDSVNTIHLVSYDLDGVTDTPPQGTDIRFTVDLKGAGKYIILILSFGFSDPAGSYNVEIRGDRGGDVFYASVQSGQPVSHLAFRFLPGDPTIPPP